MNLYVLGGAVVVAGALGFAGGWQVEAWRNDARELKRQQDAATERFKKTEKADVAAVGHEAFKAKEEIRYVTREKIVRTVVDRPVYRNICIDDDGVRILNDAIAGRDPAGEPAPALRGSRNDP